MVSFFNTDDLWTNNKLVFRRNKNKTFDVFGNSEWIINENSNLKRFGIMDFTRILNFTKNVSLCKPSITSASAVRKEFLTKEKILFNEEKNFVTSKIMSFLNIVK